jgi:serine-type D-Ala-D-Ala carboxypeptidase/endopeptidase (penicillin-binding protein 4)
MTITKRNLILTVSIAIIAFASGSTAFGQTSRPPLLQNIEVPRERTVPVASATPLVQRTGSSAPSAAFPSGVRTMFPVLASVSIPGFSGILIESMDGNVVLESNADLAFNPASNVKTATTFAVLKTFGPEFRFLTNVYTDGAVDRATGTLNGNLYVSGKDPVFGYQHGITLANELNRLGILRIVGDLVVTDNFVMNYSASPSVSAQTLQLTLDPTRRPVAATRVWQNHLAYSPTYQAVSGMPGVTFTGRTYVQSIPSSLNLLFTHESTPIKEILKATMCYSNNFLSERMGDLVGGPYAVARIVQQNAGVHPHEFSIQTSSGLGINRVTPSAMMKLLRALRKDLDRYKMTFADVMPVAGIDRGTLEGRFDNVFARGSVVGKTGTLPRTDGGVSALAGEVNTRNGRLLFVIFNMKGGVPAFRSFQNNFVSLVQGQFGGAQGLNYEPVSLETRLARNRVSYPTARTTGE